MSDGTSRTAPGTLSRFPTQLHPIQALPLKVASKSVTDLLTYYETAKFSINTPEVDISFHFSSEAPTAPCSNELKKDGRSELLVHISPASRAELERLYKNPTFAPRCLYFGADTMLNEEGMIVGKPDVSENERRQCQFARWVVFWNIEEVVSRALDTISNIATPYRLAMQSSVLNECERLFSATMGVNREGQRRMISFTLKSDPEMFASSSQVQPERAGRRNRVRALTEDDPSPHVCSQRGKAQSDGRQPRHHRAAWRLFRAIICLPGPEPPSQSFLGTEKHFYDTDDESIAAIKERL